MAFSSFSDSGDGGDLAEINMVPLIDVMLVLLVIFIITAPLLTHAIKVELPRASSSPNRPQPENIQLAIDAQSRLWWNGKAIAESSLTVHMRTAAQLQPQPELHLHAARNTPYEKVAHLMSEAARHGLTRIGFVTEPTR